MIVFTAATVGVLCSNWLGARARADLEETLSSHVAALETLMIEWMRTGRPVESVQEQVRRLGSALGTRLTVMDAEGTVLGDSQGHPAAMDNHLDRPEVRAALETGEPATVSRHSGTLNRDFTYVAMPVRLDGEVAGIVRAASLVASSKRRRAELAALVAVAAAAAALLASGIAFLLGRRFTNSLHKLNSAVEAMMAGDDHARVEVTGTDEVAGLARAFNTMSARLADRLETITMDRNKLRAVLGGMVEGVLAVDAEERVVHCNGAATSLFGVEDQDAVGRSVWEVVRWPRLTGALEGCLSGGESTRLEMSLPGAAGESMVEVRATSLRDGRGDPVGAVLVIHDVSRIRKLEQMRRDFVANVSHELKTPLAAIKGYCETLLEDREMPQETRERFLRKVARQTDRLGMLVSDLLTLSRLDEGSGYLADAEPCDWNRVACESVRELVPMAEQKGLDLSMDVPDGPVVVAAEPEALRQIVDNLVDNAIKYTPAGGSVLVSLSADGGEAILEVKDTGIGMSAEHQERVFERFYRVDRARSRELGGTGLGLAIVKNIVLDLGGRVGLQSGPGSGSTFRIVLPVADNGSSEQRE